MKKKNQKQTKKPSLISKLLPFLTLILCVYAGVHIGHRIANAFINHYHEAEEKPVIEIRPDEHEGTRVEAASEAGFCMMDVINARVNIYTNAVFSKETVAGAAFNGDIFLAETDLRTISHEVSHVVDFLLEQRGITDYETEAYVQGWLTECVHELVSHSYRTMTIENHE